MLKWELEILSLVLIPLYYKDFIKYQPYQGTQSYRRKNENLYIGGLKIMRIEYEYVNNILCSLVIPIENSDVSAFKDMYSEIYGEPVILLEGGSLSEGGHQRFIWRGKKVELQLTDVGMIFYNLIDCDKAKERARIQQKNKEMSDF